MNEGHCGSSGFGCSVKLCILLLRLYPNHGTRETALFGDRARRCARCYCISAALRSQWCVCGRENVNETRRSFHHTRLTAKNKRHLISLQLFLGRNFLLWIRAETQRCDGSQHDDVMHTWVEKIYKWRVSAPPTKENTSRGNDSWSGH